MFEVQVTARDTHLGGAKFYNSSPRNSSAKYKNGYGSILCLLSNQVLSIVWIVPQTPVLFVVSALLASVLSIPLTLSSATQTSIEIELAR
jgi:hypothetical protein